MKFRLIMALVQIFEFGVRAIVASNVIMHGNQRLGSPKDHLDRMADRIEHMVKHPDIYSSGGI